MKKIIETIIRWVGLVHWQSRTSSMSDADKKAIWELLAKNHYVVVTWRKNHLSSYFISLGHFLLGVWAWVRMPGRMPMPKFGCYAHALFNIERIDNPKVSTDFELVEAVGRGVIPSSFEDVFNCTGACLLEPAIPPESWQALADRGFDRIGTAYDFDFNLDDPSKLSCVELVLFMLKGDLDYEIKYQDLIHEIHLLKNLDPQMYRDSKSFRVVYETK